MALWVWIRKRIIDRFRQYGPIAGFRQIFQAAVRKIYHVNQDIVFFRPDHKGYSFADETIKTFNRVRIVRAMAEGEITEDEGSQLLEFVDTGCQGVYADIGGRIGGYAFLQYTGTYNFGRIGRLPIPKDFVVAKNLLVYSAYRGRGLAVKLDTACLALIPTGKIPVVFIIPENRYAIRNWETCGFQRVFFVSCVCVFGRVWKVQKRLLSDLPRNRELMDAIHYN